MHRRFGRALLPLVSISSVLAAPQLASSGPPEPPHACGDLIREASNTLIVNAIDVYNCWITVPFISAISTRFVKYWNDTLQFQSTLDYLKAPPTGYQQPAVDLIAGLNEIQTTIANGGFANEYQFEAALQNVLYSANDAHVSLTAGLLSSFSFGSSNGLTSLSLDGVELPKVYLTNDLLLNQTKDPGQTWLPSAISQINGTDVNDYLSRFAALNSPGTLEPHADWNLLMDNPLQEVLDTSALWDGAATFYPGDTFSYTFENDSKLDDQWLAAYFDPGPTGPLETGGDFYNFFVLGFYPASYVAPNVSNYTVSESPSAAPTSFADLTSAFPEHPDIAQSDLTDTGFVTGYFLPEKSLAVLSIPTFSADGDAIKSFTEAIQQFLTKSKAAGLRKVLVDLQQNTGGDELLAFSVFKQFFPSIEPYSGSIMRAQELGNLVGSAITPFWESLDTTSETYVDASSDEWIATIRLNADTNSNFSSWSELFGPTWDGVQNSTLVQRLNTSNYPFDFSSFGEEAPPDVLLTPYVGNAPYAAEDIVMLSDALCASACSLFMEMMHYDAGVYNVVVGGRPSYGPMQTPSGSRGARFYDVSELDADIENAVAIYGNESSSLPNRTDQNYYVYDGGISLRAQIRKNETVPLALQFDAADCRIFYTPETFNNFTNLWSYAADAIWTSPQHCVQGSTGFATSSKASSTTPLNPPPTASPPASINYTAIGIPYLNTSDKDIAFLVYDGPVPDILPEFAVFRDPNLETSEFFVSNPVTLNPAAKNSPNVPPPPPSPPQTIRHGNLSQKKFRANAPPPTVRRRRRRSLRKT
ncbi:MAG: hypothetical protein M1821_002015 [Bathelium mastoideum]|nr:MAG: hypothetical protein M1821_002015 [Bathelium mastoideum]